MLKYQARLESELKNIADDIDSVTGSERKNLEKQQTNIANKVNEIKKYDEKIKYFTEHKVSIDLDDGVMVNYTNDYIKRSKEEKEILNGLEKIAYSCNSLGYEKH